MLHSSIHQYISMQRFHGLYVAVLKLYLRYKRNERRVDLQVADSNSEIRDSQWCQFLSRNEVCCVSLGFIFSDEYCASSAPFPVCIQVFMALLLPSLVSFISEFCYLGSTCAVGFFPQCLNGAQGLLLRGCYSVTDLYPQLCS